MAASTAPIPVKDFVLKVGGDPVGYSTGVTINLTHEAVTAPAHSGDANWQSSTYGKRGWTADVPALLDDTGALITGANLGITIAIPAGAAKALCLEDASVAITVDMEELTSTCVGVWRTVAPRRRGVTVTANSIYYDPAPSGGNADGQELAINELLTTSTGLTLVLTVGSLTLTGLFRVTGGNLGGTQPGWVKAPYTFVSDGEVDLGLSDGDVDDGLYNLFQAVFAADASSSVAFVAGPAAVGSTTYSGTGYVSALNLTLPYLSAQATFSATITGTGALAEVIVPA